MINKMRAVKLLSICFGVLLVCATFLTIYVPNSDAKVDNKGEVYNITDISVTNFAALAISNENMNFGLMQLEEGIEIVSDVQGEYDESQIRSLIYAACHLSGTKKNTDKSTWAGMGFDNPKAKVSIINSDGTTVSFNILMQNTLDESYFVYSKEEDAIFLVAKSVAELFLRRESDFFAHTVLPNVDGKNYKQLSTLEVDFNNAKDGYKIEQKENGFYIVDPMLHRVPTLDFLQNLVYYMSGLYSDSYIDKIEDVKELGFDNYDVRIKMSFDNNDYEILLLDKGGDTCYMLNVNTGDVYEVKNSNLTMLLQSHIDLLGGEIYNYTMGDLNDLNVSYDQTSHFVEFKGEGEQLTATIDKQTLNSVQAVELMSAINDLKIASVASEDATFDKEEMSINFTFKTGLSENVEIFALSEDLFAVRINGVYNFNTNKKSIDKVKEIMEKQW